MITQPYRVAVSRWGDTLWRLALLLTADPVAARAAIVRAFVHACATPSADTEMTLVQALIHQPQPWQHPLRRRMLPRPLARVTPTDRVLLALWLLQNSDGPRLATVASLPHETVVAQLATALVSLLPRPDPAHTPAGRAALTIWLAQQLGVAAVDDPPLTDEWQAAQVTWQAAVERLHEILQATVGQHHLPRQVQAAIEAALSSQAEDTLAQWWQRPPVQLGALVAGTLLLLLLLIAPWGGAATPATAAAPMPARELVQQALDAWTTMPVSGALHRRVWAVDGRLSNTPAVVTDLWLEAENSRHRIEVRKDKLLVEWQLADGPNRLLYAADPRYSACSWQDSSVLDRRARAYVVGAAQQQAARNARLTLGAYGEGYHFLQAALAASDLRSLGTQRAGDRTLVLVRYTDQRQPAPRQFLLAIDPTTRELQTVREVMGSGTQIVVRDLWRLEAEEAHLMGVSMAAPRWPDATLERDQLLDPTCPGLDPDHVVSLRVIASSNWWYLPNKLPPGITRAALLTPASVTQDTYNSIASASAIFVGPERWLRLFAPQYGPPSYRSNGMQRGSWYVRLEEQQDKLIGMLCKITRFPGSQDQSCAPEIAITARGWSRDEFLKMIDTLAPADPQTWLALDDVFLDPQPLSPQVRSVFAKAFAALQPQEQRILYTAFDGSRRVSPNRPKRQDPYYVPLQIVEPARFQNQQWLVFSNDQMKQFKQISTATDGTLIAVELSNGANSYRYHRAEGKLWIAPAEQALWWNGTQPGSRASEILRSLWGNPQPISLIEQGNAWLLEQRSEPLLAGMAANFWVDMTWADDLPPGSIAQQLFIDRTTALPQRFVVTHLDEQGHETLLYRSVLTEWRYLDDESVSRFFTLPRLPDDTLTIDWQSNTVRGASFDPQVPSRVLMWPDTVGTSVENDRNILSDIFSSPRHNQQLMGALFRPLIELDRTGLLKATTYRMPPGDWRVTIRQGPRDLLRHNLRHQSAFAPNWTSSRAIKVTIAGEERTAWLLESDNPSPPTALVVEVDDLLVHISSPDAANLEGSILAKLPELEWVELKARD